MNSIKEIGQNCKFETIINKSKFIAWSFAVHNISEIKNILTQLKEEYRDSTHICYAYKMLGSEKCNDDGEPQGTAGRPILECIKKGGFENTLVVVVRYFGGIKLGAGGLLRAYQNSASGVLLKSGQKSVFQCKKIDFEIGISDIKVIEKIKKIEDIKDIKIDYSLSIAVSIFCEEKDIENIEILIKNLLRKDMNFKVNEQVFYV